MIPGPRQDVFQTSQLLSTQESRAQCYQSIAVDLSKNQVFCVWDQSTSVCGSKILSVTVAISVCLLGGQIFPAVAFFPSDDPSNDTLWVSEYYYSPE